MLLQREIADVLMRDVGRDLLVTVTHVRVTADLSIAYVYFSVFGDSAKDRQAAFQHLESQLARIRRAVAQRLRHQLRAIPEFRFFLDESLQESRKMDSLFERIREERAQRETAS